MAGIVARAILVLVSCAVVFLLVEGFLWVAGVAPPILHFGSPRIYQPDRDLIYSLRPGGAIDTNRAGLRGPEISNDVFGSRVIALGDSYTYGHHVGYESSYPALLQERLNRGLLPETRFEVINAGVPGYNVDQAYALLTRRLNGLQPDWVILIVEPKDLAGSNVLFDLEEGELVAVPAWKNWIYPQLWLRTQAPEWIKRTHLYRFFVGRLAGSDPMGTLPSQDLDEQIEWQIAKIERLVSDLVARGQRDGFEVLVVNYPDRPALISGGDYTKSTYFGLPVHILGPRANLHMKNLHEALARTGAHFVDGMESFLERGDRPITIDALYQGDDPHMTREGNAELAALIANAITEISQARGVGSDGDGGVRSRPNRR